ncbi:hypothetical protein AXF42_Ash019419 [Apostasia shenzhenica]|uniref:Protein BLISTER n=1 Tax=Apostasia shenzhenica TaxID=1088818 RepID=A0A2I0B4W1_9ASPA|nr:hypothetical protein AXF42_Ash019419 [Apostasia shenzhenica]
MASPQILPNSSAVSRKQGHLEAGKKKLEEFRKRKAEGRAKKVNSTSSLQSADGVSDERSSLYHENEGDGAAPITSTSFSESYTSAKLKDLYSSNGEIVISSNKNQSDLSGLDYYNHSSSDISQNLENFAISNIYEKSGHGKLVNGYHDHWMDRRGFSSDNDISKFESVNASITSQLTSVDSIHTKFDLDNNLNNASVSHAQSDQSKNSLSLLTGDLNASTSWLENSQNFSAESRSADLSSSYNDSAIVLGLRNPGSISNNSFVDFQVGRKKISEAISQHLNLNGATEPSFAKSTMSVRPQEDRLIPSTSYGMPFVRSRPSFLDTLGVSMVSSTSDVQDYEPEKNNQPDSFGVSRTQIANIHFPSPQQSFTHVTNLQQSSEKNNALFSFGDSKAQGVDFHFPSPQQSFTHATTLQESFISSTSGLVDEKVNSSVLSQDMQMLEMVGDYHQKGHAILIPNKDEDFSALEQHIEDLTQEKFALQRALDTSRTLAESLATENSSLTESYNQQAKLVNEFKSEIERLQEEVQHQLRAVESFKLEYANAQLECNAADERAKILASEVIGLEDKALRLRSNELKLEKQVDNLSSEISSYKRKVSLFEKERQDFQATINAMLEEKKLLQSKIRKASSTSNFFHTAKASSSKRDMSTSTEDLGEEIDKEANGGEMMASDAITQRQYNTPSADIATANSLLPDDRSFYLSYDFVGIPHDQLRMVENISSLLSELVVEKEELMQALTMEASNSSELKDLNKELSRKLEIQTQRLELLTAQSMVNESVMSKPIDIRNQETLEYADEGDEVVETLGWIMKLFPGGPSKRRTSKLL